MTILKNLDNEANKEIKSFLKKQLEERRKFRHEILNLRSQRNRFNMLSKNKKGFC